MPSADAAAPPALLKVPLKTEFAVDLHCGSCEETVKKASVIIESVTPPSLLFNALRSTGLGTVLKGQTSATGAQHIGAAVCIFECFTGAKGWAQHNNKGLARMVQLDNDTCLFDVTVDGMPPGEHSVSIHECGDISGGCESTGKALKQLGRVIVDAQGRGDLVLEERDVKVWDVIGRSIVIDKLNRGRASGEATCGIIARSAGVFENPKTVCSCDGKTLWEEAGVAKM
ncbi:superoxide dismutase [Fimicolochytrium jonesii]|uniref:superoxide dismutase n=1 Tax=Fimicolochytrium jonesii TaxID=1396493 RepID=UPI0022FEF68A|nr:superoxide dismutase [Fimicolochytrium jonesii]KAI8822502.1 superoxide dismutase [Fimicolochytrium jonesii]